MVESANISQNVNASTSLHAVLEKSQGQILVSSGAANASNSASTLDSALPLPIFKYKNAKDKYLVNSEVIERFGELVAKHGVGIWREWSVEDLLPEKFRVHASDLHKLEKTFLDEKFINACCLQHLTDTLDEF